MSNGSASSHTIPVNAASGISAELGARTQAGGGCATDDIELVNPLDDPTWDERISRHSHCCFFHGAAWPRVLKESYRQAPVYFTVPGRSGLAGLIPVIEVKSLLTGARGVSSAFTDVCPPISSSRQEYLRLLDRVLQYGRTRGWKYLECRGGFELLEGAAPSASFFGHLLDLSLGEERLLKAFEGRVRNAVRKAEAAGVRVEVSTDEQAMLEFYRLHSQTRRKHGVPPQPFSFFENIQRHIVSKGQGTVVMARLDRAPIAAAVFFHLGSRVIYKYSASDKLAQQVRPNNLVMWEAIRWYARAGFGELHFGRTSMSNEGLRLYKRGFGTQEFQLDYFRYDFQREAFIPGAERPPDWKNRVCSRLPETWLRFIGRVLYKHMS